MGQEGAYLAVPKGLPKSRSTASQLDTIVDTFVTTEEYEHALQNQSTFLNKLVKIPGAGVILAALSGIFFATGSLIVKLVHHIPAIEIVVIRSLVQALVYAVVMTASGNSPFGVASERFALFMRCLMGFISASCSYVSFRKIPLGDASSIIFSSPIFVTVIACILLHEPCGAFQCFTLLLGLIGIALICKPTYLLNASTDVISQDRLIGTLLALLASLCAALVFISMRKLQKTPSSVSIFCFSLFSCTAGSIILLIMQEFELPLGIWEWLLMLAIGLCGACGQLFLTFALKIEDAGPVSLARTMDIVMAFVYQIFVLNQEIQLTSLIGAIIVCSGVILIALYKWYLKKPEVFYPITQFCMDKNSPTPSIVKNDSTKLTV